MIKRETLDAGLGFSRLGIGTNTFGTGYWPRDVDPATATRIVDVALDAGVTFFDTAEEYGDGQSELQLGAALKGRRQRATIATKFSPTSDPIAACEGSLRRLETDYIDLYQMHGPNPAVPIEVTLEKLDRLVRSGKVRAIGHSNFSGWQIAEAAWQARTSGLTRFVTAQNRYNLLQRQAEADVIPACTNYQVGFIPFQPLAAGMLTGKYRRGVPPPPMSRMLGTRIPTAQRFLNDPMFDKVESLERFAADRSISLLSVAIGSLIARPEIVTVITGVTTPDQVKANVEASAWIPTSEELQELTGPLPR